MAIKLLIVTSKRFAIMGVAGYVAPKHLNAIFELGHELVAAMDIHDSVGILDQYFPRCQFFTSFERFERFLEKEKRNGQPIDYLVICTPNHLHDAHCRFGLRIGADVICEKPLVLNPWNVDALVKAEEEYGRRIANILQLRFHPELDLLKKNPVALSSRGLLEVELDYITPRGPWYNISWKGDILKSGGILTNIGVHLFDILLWLYGSVKDFKIESDGLLHSQGILHLDKANVKWNLSIEQSQLELKEKSLRRLKYENTIVNLDSGFNNLHKKSYESILKGDIIGPKDVRSLIDLLYQMRNNKS